MLADDKKKMHIEVLRLLDSAIEKGEWDSSLFLRATRDKLKKLREEFFDLADLRSAVSPNDQTPGLAADKAKQRSEFVFAYISLYNATGSQLRTWEKLMGGLNQILISRPIFRKESDVQALIRTKSHRENEAYLVVRVSPSVMMSLPSHTSINPLFNQKLVVLKDAVIQHENIERFEHLSGSYTWVDGRLILIKVSQVTVEPSESEPE